MNELGERIKSYERVYDQYLTPNSSVIIRVDGKAFHTYTQYMDKPFSFELTDAMNITASQTAKEMQGFKLGYGQSDEFSFLITDFDTNETQGWFGYRLNKLVSITASMFTYHFNKTLGFPKPAFFDARAFVVPDTDVPNVFVWRQKDWERNSIQMLAQSHFSQKKLQNKKVPDLHDMLHEIGVNWNDCKAWEKNGSWLTKDVHFEYDKKNYEQIKELLDDTEGS